MICNFSSDFRIENAGRLSNNFSRYLTILRLEICINEHLLGYLLGIVAGKNWCLIMILSNIDAQKNIYMNVQAIKNYKKLQQNKIQQLNHESRK